MSCLEPDELAEALLGTAEAAGVAILEHYGTSAGVRLKADRTPVTDADLAADRVIAARLGALFPDIPLVSEEGVEAFEGGVEGAGRFFLVDPLDGTREFLERTGEFTVNIGLIEAGRPAAGIVHAPALGETFLAVAGSAYWISGGTRRGPLRARRQEGDTAVILASRFHRDPQTDAFIAEQGKARVITAGSALKFGVLARGDADLYPRFGRTMEWDTAAGHAVLKAAGGSVRTLDGAELGYGKPGFENPSFIARGRD
ncbi:MAG: 3'(2'),5'-bisphosphate nucleotidase CysQ [Alphaproteobacteria bacterium]